ncbi:thioredoxin-disulfide reductase [bacterium]|nr:thioredoxin-disulfide reductase [bacterium]
MYELIIIGGGPAGLTAGLYASRARLKTLLMESSSLSSQLLLGDKIENYPGFTPGIETFELIIQFKKQALAFGLKIIDEEVQTLRIKEEKNSKLWQVVTKQKEYTAQAVIIATGAKPRKLNISGEEEFRGRGVSYCATCDGAFYKGKDIVVIGGGDTAIEEALHLTKFVNKITLIHRRNRLRATSILQERVFSQKKIDFLWETQVTGILGKEKVEAVKIKDIKTQQEKKFPCQGVFIFVGFKPNTDFLKIHPSSKEKNLIELDEEGYIIVDDNMFSSVEGIFAGGDCRHKLLRQVITACGDGATAAFSAQRYVERLTGRAYDFK